MTDSNRNPQAALFPATHPIVEIKDAHIEPAKFSTSGQVGDVLERTKTAIEAEQGFDVRQRAANVEISARNGALTFDRGATTRYAYTHTAFEQLTEKTAGLKVKGTQGKFTSPSKFADVSLWASPTIRGELFADMLANARNSNKSKIQVFRCAYDAHSADTSRHSLAYIRGVVSEGHAHESGDDLAFLQALQTFVFSSQFTADFATGNAYIVRDPEGDTSGYLDSARKLPGNARLTLSFRNNEIGEGAANVSLSLTFEFDAEKTRVDAEGKKQTYRISLAIPGARSSGRAIHRGGRVGMMFEGFAESVVLALGWAPTACEKLLATTVDAANLDPVTEGLEGADWRARANEMDSFRALLSSQGITPRGTALEAALVLSHFGCAKASQKIVETVCGLI